MEAFKDTLPIVCNGFNEIDTGIIEYKFEAWTNLKVRSFIACGHAQNYYPALLTILWWFFIP